MRYLLVVVIVALGVAAAYALRQDEDSTPSQAARLEGPLRVEDGRIVTASGDPVRLLSVTEPSLIGGAGNNRLTDPDACGDGYVPLDRATFENVERFGFNSVRLGISWANLQPDPPAGGDPGWNQQYLQTLDDAVRGFTSRGVGVILDMHANNLSPAFKQPKPERCQGSGLPAWLFPDAAGTDAQTAECDFLAGRRPAVAGVDPLDGYAQAWQLVAERYAGNQLVVAADIFNEPRCPGLDLAAFYERMGAAIRAAGPNLLLVYQNNAARGGEFALTAPPDLDDAVYSFHLYPRDWSEGEPILRAHLDLTRDWGDPVWIGEFGVFREKGRGEEPGQRWLADLAAMMDACRQADVGWAFHQYAGGGGSLVSRDTGAVRRDWVAGLQAGF